MGQTAATQMVAPAPLANGRHTYQLSAVNLAGVTTNSPVATVFVDTVPPRATWRLSGSVDRQHPRAAARQLRRSPPAGLPKSGASGVSTVLRELG